MFPDAGRDIASGLCDLPSSPAEVLPAELAETLTAVLRPKDAHFTVTCAEEHGDRRPTAAGRGSGAHPEHGFTVTIEDDIAVIDVSVFSTPTQRHQPGTPRPKPRRRCCAPSPIAVP